MALSDTAKAALAAEESLKRQILIIRDIENLTARAPEQDQGDAIRLAFERNPKFDPKAAGAEDVLTALQQEIAERNRSVLVAKQTALKEFIDRGGDITARKAYASPFEEDLITAGGTPDWIQDPGKAVQLRGPRPRLEAPNRQVNTPSGRLDPALLVAPYGPDRIQKEQEARISAGPQTAAEATGVESMRRLGISPTGALARVRNTLAEKEGAAAVEAAWAKDIEKFKAATKALGLSPQQMEAFDLGETIELSPAQHRDALTSDSRILSEMVSKYGKIGPPSKYGFNREGVIGSVASMLPLVLGNPSRSVAAGEAGMAAELGKLTADVPMQAVPEDESISNKFSRAVAVLGAGAAPILMAGGPLAVIAAWQAMPEGTRKLGVPVKEAVRRLAADPSKIPQVLEAGKRYAKASLFATDPQAPTDYMTALQNTAARYQEEAGKRAATELPPPPEDTASPEYEAWAKQFMVRAKTHYDGLVKNEVDPVNHEILGSLWLETMLDPSNLVNPATVVKAGAAVAKKLPGVEKAARRAAVSVLGSPASQAAQSIFRHPVMVATAPMNVASEGMAEAASLARMVEAEASGKIERPLRDLLNDPRMALFSKMSDAENAHLFAAAKAGVPVEALPEGNYREAYAFFREVYDPGGTREQLRDLAGAGQHVDKRTGILLPGGKEEIYVPEQVQMKDPNLPDAPRPVVHALTEHIPSSAMEKRGGRPVQNLGVQMAADLQASIRDFPASYRTKRMAELTGVDVSNELAAGVASAEELVKEIPRSTTMITVPNVDLAEAGRVNEARNKALSRMLDMQIEPSLEPVELSKIPAGKLNPERQYLLTPAAELLPRLEKNIAELQEYAKAFPNDPAIADTFKTLKDQVRRKVAFDKTVAAVNKGRLQYAEGARITGDVEQMKALLKEQTNLDWSVLPPTLGEAIQIHAGTPGSTRVGIGKIRGNGALLVPEPARKMLSDLHMIMGDKRGWDQSYRAVMEFNRKTFYQLHRLWRTPKTLLNPAFAPVNALSVPMLAFVADGITGLNPRIHGGAALSAIAAAGVGSKLARNVPFRLRSGKTITLGRLVDIAQETGLDQQMKARLAELPKQAAEDVTPRWQKPLTAAAKIPGLAAEVPEAIAKYTGLKFAAGASENYQHMIGLALFLEDDTPLAIAKALDKHNRHFGNYRLLSKYERALSSSGVIGFYPWARFIFPAMMQSLLAHPERFAPFARGMRLGEAAWGNQSPSRGLMPPWLQTMNAFTAPPSGQPLSLGDQIRHEGGIQNPGSHEYAVQVMRSPLNMLLPYAAALTKTLGWGTQDYDSQRGDLKDYLGYLASTVWSIMSKTNLRDGSAQPEVFHLIPDRGETGAQWASRFSHSTIGNALYGFVDRPTDAVRNAYKLYFEDGRPAEAMDLWLRAYAGRTYGWLGNQALGLISGKGDMSLGGFIDPEYAVKPAQQLSTIQRQGVEEMQDRARSLSR
jgi:hypothetical protein